MIFEPEIKSSKKKAELHTDHMNIKGKGEDRRLKYVRNVYPLTNISSPTSDAQ